MAAFLAGGIEWAIRPFQQAEGVLARIVAQRPPVDEDAEANLRWGKESDFDEPVRGGLIGTTVTITYPDFPPDDPEDVPPETQVLEFEEISRESETVRVENPDDEDQYVMVKRALVSLLQGPDIRPDSQVGTEGRQPFIYVRVTWKNEEEEA